MGFESKANNVVIKIRSSVFTFSVILVHILYLALFFGIAFINEEYIRVLSTIIQSFVSIFLTIRFNPFTNDNRISEFDKQVIFYSATFLLLNVVATEVYTSFIQNSPLDPVIKTAQSSMISLIKPNDGSSQAGSEKQHK